MCASRAPTALVLDDSYSSFGSPVRRNRPLAAFVRGLPSLAVRPMSDSTTGRIDELAAGHALHQREVEALDGLSGGALLGTVRDEARADLSRRARIVGIEPGAARRPSGLRLAPGVSVESRVVPLDRVGCYVPAGRYPLPSSLLMTAIPAVAAGVREVLVVCPRPEPVVMAAALEAGISRFFRVGGAVFADVGRAWEGENQNTVNPGWLHDIGLGLRFVNARTAFGQVLHADLAFPLNREGDIRPAQFLLRTRVAL